MTTPAKILQDIVDSANWIREKYGPPTILRMSLPTWLELKAMVEASSEFRARDLNDALLTDSVGEGISILGQPVQIDTDLDAGVIEIVHRMKVQEIADARS